MVTGKMVGPEGITEVRLGPFALFLPDFRIVCSTPMSGAKADIVEGPESATSRPEQVQQTEQALLDHLVGAEQERF